MPRFFMAGTNIMGGMAIMRGRDAQHIQVLRMRPGEDMIICDGQGTDYKCRLVKADKEQAKKVLEEAAEVFGAWQNRELGIVCDSLLDEIADLITASCNLASALGFDDLRPAMEACRKRNEERGRYDR